MTTFLDEFVQAPGLRYLNHAAVAPWPNRAASAVARFAQENVLLGARDYSDWMALEQRLRERLMRLLNAPSTDDIALVKNTSEALSFVAFGLPWQSGDQIVISDEEFPSNRIVWEALATQGVEVIQASLKGDDPEGALLAACGPRTRLMSVSAVQFASGLRLDLQRLGAGCKQQNVLFCIDAIQQLGALPFDVQSYQCDFAMADGHKWLLGPGAWGCSTCAVNCANNSSCMSSAGTCLNTWATTAAPPGSRPRVPGVLSAAARTCSAQWHWRPVCRYWKKSACQLWPP